MNGMMFCLCLNHFTASSRNEYNIKFNRVDSAIWAISNKCSMSSIHFFTTSFPLLNVLGFLIKSPIIALRESIKVGSIIKYYLNYPSLT